VYSRPISIQGFSGLLVFWSAPLPTGDQQTRSPAVHVQNLGLLLSRMFTSRGDLLRPRHSRSSDFHRQWQAFTDFRNLCRKRKIGGLPKPSSLISASPPSIFAQNTGAQPVRRNFTDNELPRTDSRAPDHGKIAVLVDDRTHAIHQAPHSEIACASQFLVPVPETQRFGEASWAE
jgi:hypothetical protein